MATTMHVSDVAELLSEGRTHFNLSPALLVEHAARRNEAHLAANGAIVGYTNRTGRSPKDKFIVKDETTAHSVAWGAVNVAFEPEKFDALYVRVMEHLRGRELFVQDLFCGADPAYRLPVRIVNEHAWHNLFVHQLFLRPGAEELKHHHPEFTVISAPEFKADPKRDGVNSEVFIILNFTRRTVLIGGTSYAGKMKKSIFSVMNFLLPQRNVFPMHCSANVGHNGVTALFFGLSGTGKTTLLNVLSRFIPEEERIVTIEDSAELQMKQEHVVRLETNPANIEGRGEVTQRDLVRNSLRMRPDRIIVGEVRGAEVLDMLQAMNTGHDGSLTTIHANSPRDALLRLETLVAMAGLNIPNDAVRRYISSAIDVVIQIARLYDGSRKLVSFQEVTGMESGIISMQELFVFEQAGVDENGTVKGQIKSMGVMPGFLERFKALGIPIPYDIFDRRKR